MPTPVESRKSWPKNYGKRVAEPNARQRRVLEELAELGDQRAGLVDHKAYMTSSGRRVLDEIYAAIRRQIARGVELGLGHEQMRERVRVTSTAYYKIKSGRTGAGD